MLSVVPKVFAMFGGRLLASPKTDSANILESESGRFGEPERASNFFLPNYSADSARLPKVHSKKKMAAKLPRSKIEGTRKFRRNRSIGDLRANFLDFPVELSARRKIIWGGCSYTERCARFFSFVRFIVGPNRSYPTRAIGVSAGIGKKTGFERISAEPFALKFFPRKVNLVLGSRCYVVQYSVTFPTFAVRIFYRGLLHVKGTRKTCPTRARSFHR
jgi:hypothetical protein